MARPTKYNKEILEKANKYLTDYKNQELGKLIPSAEGLAIYLNVSTKTIYNWGNEHPEFLQTLGEVNTRQKILLLDGGLSGEFNSNITKLALGNHGMSEKTEQKMSGAIGVLDMSALTEDELDSKLRQLASQNEQSEKE